MSGFQALPVFPDEVQQLSMNKEEACPEQQEKHEPLKIKDEPEELWSDQGRDQLQGREEDDIKFTFVPVLVKSEDDEEEPQSSQHYQKQTKESARYFDPERDLQQHSEVKTEDSSDPETDDSADWREMTEHQSGLKSVEKSREMRAKITKKLYICSECGKRFKGEQGLTRHIVVHTKGKPFSCTECGQRFTQKGTLTVHMRIHTGEKPFVCSQCDQRFSVKGNLAAHMRTHTGEKPFVCSECGKKFSQHATLNRHKLLHTREKPFSRSQCSERIPGGVVADSVVCPGTMVSGTDQWLLPLGTLETLVATSSSVVMTTFLVLQTNGPAAPCHNGH
ncbi:oocyte zinc finger protein XlCOF20-like [Cheilinus undulatus]|uniref:oocyte zinc finger protein XlCOF20-like n=1 Tax=Cheilinus undulatus TaxID=241271 RepID=UPI001BD375C3|nr:oocyte zinc finger protein XlCOF20-like [Cheilinus undulatus]